MSADLDRRRRFEALVVDVHDPLQRYLRRRSSAAAADDLLGDVLLVLWRRLDDVPAADPLPWCFGIARRCLANHRRGDARRLRLVERVGWVDPPCPTFDHIPMDHEDPSLVAALGVLSPGEREIVYLWAWEQLEPWEIALVVERTANAVSVALTRARRKLADELSRQGTGPTGQEPVARKDTDRRGRG